MSQSDAKNAALPRRGFIQKAAAGLGAAALGELGAKQAEAAKPKRRWDLAADVVVVGAGAAGLPASITAAEQGASVIVVDQNYDIGGHAIESGGNIALGGGTSLQKKYGIADSPDRMFDDLAHWHDYRFSDRGNCARLLRRERSHV
ncbi:MAG TPA: FAD-dependent oxidoreductase [Bryobacteraceae bacterium]|nr:FAD-dependent oxidoreductase [Bryobacteraceae bacterium]